MKLKELARSIKYWLGGPKKSYSQTGEDIISDFFLGKEGKGFYVDVGANDPINLSNTYYFYKKGWRGICLEPDSFKAKLFKKIRRKDIVLNMGAGLQSGEMNFYSFYPDIISTFSQAESEEFQKLGHKLLSITKVKILPLKQILDEHANGREIDLLSVDTEGFDLDVLKSNDWSKYRAKIVICEIGSYRGTTLIPQEKIFSEFMTSVGYHKLANTYINGIYIESNFAKLKSLTFDSDNKI